MPNLAIVTDSTASIPEAMLIELNIHGVAYYIHRGREVLRDLVSIRREEFLRWLPTAMAPALAVHTGRGTVFLSGKRVTSPEVTRGDRPHSFVSW